MRSRGSANVFAVVTMLSGLVVGGLVLTGYIVFTSISSGRFELAGLASVLGLIGLGAAVGFLLGGSVAAGAALLGTVTRDTKWAWLRFTRPIAPFVGAYIALLWLPLLMNQAPGAEGFVFILIPSATVGVTSWLPWAGGFMNSRSVKDVPAVEPGTSGEATNLTSSGLRRGWGEVVLVVGSILIITIALVALVFSAPGSESLGAGRGPSAVILAGLGTIGAVIALLKLRPETSSEERGRVTERNGDPENSAAGGKL